MLQRTRGLGLAVVVGRIGPICSGDGHWPSFIATDASDAADATDASEASENERDRVRRAIVEARPRKVWHSHRNA
jgi:hypothetical protein